MTGAAARLRFSRLPRASRLSRQLCWATLRRHTFHACARFSRSPAVWSCAQAQLFGFLEQLCCVVLCVSPSGLHSMKRPASAMDSVWLPTEDYFTVDVECVLASTTQRPKRDHALRWLSAIFLLREFAQQRRDASRAEDPARVMYQRLPAEVQRLAKMKCPLTLKLRNGSILQPTDTALDIATAMKLNEEDSDYCTRQAVDILDGVDDEHEQAWKVYVICRTCSREAVDCASFRKPWKNLADGVESLLAEIAAPFALFTESFGPNCRYRGECKGAGGSRKQKEYVRQLLLEKAEDVVAIQWGKSQHAKQVTKECVFQQFMAWPGVGPLTAKNAYQLLRRFVASTKAAGRTASRRNSDQFMCTTAGARYFLNLMTAEAGGRRFHADGTSHGCLRHFSSKMLYMLQIFRKVMRDLPRARDHVLHDLVAEMEALDENDAVFIFCEAWKVLAYVATRDARYLREGVHQQDDDDDS